MVEGYIQKALLTSGSWVHVETVVSEEGISIGYSQILPTEIGKILHTFWSLNLLISTIYTN